MVDYYGKCTLCSTQCFNREGTTLKKNSAINYNLSDGTVAGILLCEDCRKVSKGSAEKAVMEQNLANGWEHELGKTNWDETRKQQYRDKYYKLKILETA